MFSLSGQGCTISPMTHHNSNSLHKPPIVAFRVNSIRAPLSVTSRDEFNQAFRDYCLPVQVHTQCVRQHAATNYELPAVCQIAAQLVAIDRMERIKRFLKPVLRGMVHVVQNARYQLCREPLVHQQLACIVDGEGLNNRIRCQPLLCQEFLPWQYPMAGFASFP